jgi:hypothetical protein
MVPMALMKKGVQELQEVRSCRMNLRIFDLMFAHSCIGPA